jgi:hypothetical protein
VQSKPKRFIAASCRAAMPMLSSAPVNGRPGALFPLSWIRASWSPIAPDLRCASLSLPPLRPAGCLVFFRNSPEPQSYDLPSSKRAGAVVQSEISSGSPEPV